MYFNVRSALLALAALGLCGAAANAQTYGFATLPPGTLNHTTASAVAKVMKEKAGVNMLVQPTAGDQVIIPMVGRGEVEVGIANIPELDGYWEGGKNPDLRLIADVDDRPFGGSRGWRRALLRRDGLIREPDRLVFVRLDQRGAACDHHRKQRDDRQQDHVAVFFAYFHAG